MNKLLITASLIISSSISIAKMGELTTAYSLRQEFEKLNSIPGDQDEAVKSLELSTIPGDQDEVVKSLELSTIPGDQDEVVKSLELSTIPGDQDEVVAPQELKASAQIKYNDLISAYRQVTAEQIISLYPEATEFIDHIQTSNFNQNTEIRAFWKFSNGICKVLGHSSLDTLDYSIKCTDNNKVISLNDRFKFF